MIAVDRAHSADSAGVVDRAHSADSAGVVDRAHSADSAGVVDLRSDTVTRPTAGMREAIASAPVGDDVYAEDPSVNALESTIAHLFGHEAALFVPTGSMGNQICLRLLAEPGQEILCDADAHIVTYEMGATAALFGLSTRTVVGDHGRLRVADYEQQVRAPDWHTVQTAAIAVENTHNRGGGTVQPLDQLTALREFTTEAGVAMHCDGARIWNAHIASGVPLHTYGALFDTLSVCLSKGLGAPVGSVIVADADRIARARILRKRLGGGMRQAGILAAAGSYALTHHLSRLADDHERARRLASGLTYAEAVETNIVVLDLKNAPVSAAELAKAASDRDVLVSVVSPQRVRLLTHLDITDADVDTAIDVLVPLLG